MASLVAAPVSYAPMVAPVASPSRAAAPVMETVQDLKVLANKLNPSIGYFNPTSLAEMEFWGQSNEATIGWLRQAEIKHGRVAMIAFVGYIVQANGIYFPWDLTLSGISHADISAAGGPAQQWDALPTNSKLQILGVIGFFEWWSENSFALSKSGTTHYMRGGKPGVFPSFNGGGIPHPAPDLFDPLGFSKNKTPEQKERGLLIELNNGRLAQIGIMGFVSEAKVPGSVPVLSGLVPAYSGETMAPFSAADNLPFVADMLKAAPF